MQQMKTTNEIQALAALADCVRSLRELVALLDEPADARPFELAKAVERAKESLRELEASR